ncbi:RNA polymerase sigma factor [Rubripirellula reticaptiva]|uniref:ECF RNA polymerase sigma-E factor n=1 Tax=Rubripirellula reticaptiva TaxID=2528013 RepID=A0A5C6EM44_9BACT|nr:sigma-70 family RNA polymerase sigma factor [Rubripirellula reticaptiva]TWU48359.1 ECF RNA polymerase sigma-E factor [Rubripirellula reticaptiva]
MDLTDAIDRFRGPLVGLIASWGASHVDASELAQDSFADAYLNRDRCRGDWQDPEVFGRWLRGIARNNFRNWLRSCRRRQRRVVSVDTATLEQTAAATAGKAESLATTDRRLIELRMAIDRLPTKQRQVILMHYLEETSVSDVAALLSVSAKTVEGRLYQARRALRRLMDEPSASGIGKALLL